MTTSRQATKRRKAAGATDGAPETNQNARASLLLALMMVLLPALGVTHEEMLQDTFKSILSAFFILSAMLVFVWYQRKQQQPLQFHGLLWLPLGLMVYALGSMAWSHAYLGGVEAIRWFLFALVFFWGVNVANPTSVNRMVWGIHIGAVLASLWAALQFWSGLTLFPQGPVPASTFLNRNIFAEFLVCTLPYSVLLLARVRDKTSVFVLTLSLAFNIVALMMSGTRSALTGLLVLMVLLPLITLVYRKQCQSTGWRPGHCIALGMVLIVSVGVLGSIRTGNPKLIAESGKVNALELAGARLLSITTKKEYSRGTFSHRTLMWRATGAMIQDNPVTGVGAGAWEVHVPRYQGPESQTELDFYAHNELLQLVAEYGSVGWLFLLSLTAYLLWASYATLKIRSAEGKQEAPLRALVLSSLLVLFLVSNAGFPWHMAGTGALFAISLSLLAASDLRLGWTRQVFARSLAWKNSYGTYAFATTVLCMALAVHISRQAIECESKLVQALKIGLQITQSGKATDPRWDPAKNEMLTLMREAIAINPHYRKLTSNAADAMANWGDWKNATWIWESIATSRPYVVAILTNIARGHVHGGELAKAGEYLERARSLQPSAPAVASLEVMLLSRAGNDKEAARLAKKYFADGVFDYDLVRAAYFLGINNEDFDLSITALELRIKHWPAQAVDSWLKLGDIHALPKVNDIPRAIHAYRTALEASPPHARPAVMASIPPHFRKALE